MYSSANVALRNKLRAQIEAEFPNQSGKEVFEKIKQEGNAYIIFEDLYPFCDAANIPYDSLTQILSPYQPRDCLLSCKKFVKFYDGALQIASPPMPISEDVSRDSVLVLTSFCTAIRVRTSPHPSERWSQILSKNPASAEPSKIRLASLCRLCDEYNLPFKPSHFIDAIFEFFGKKLDALDFEEFTKLMATFAYEN